MIAVTTLKDKQVALFGLGGSGLATAQALVAGGARVTAWDDNPESVAKAVSEGIGTGDLRQADWSAFSAFILSPGVPLTHPVSRLSAMSNFSSASGGRMHRIAPSSPLPAPTANPRRRR
jgi:UDP-N-acetylmuramoylalanine-D-glutamate ligase